MPKDLEVIEEVVIAGGGGHATFGTQTKFWGPNWMGFEALGLSIRSAHNTSCGMHIKLLPPTNLFYGQRHLEDKHIWMQFRHKGSGV